MLMDTNILVWRIFFMSGTRGDNCNPIIHVHRQYYGLFLHFRSKFIGTIDIENIIEAKSLNVVFYHCNH